MKFILTMVMIFCSSFICVQNFRKCKNDTDKSSTTKTFIYAQNFRKCKIYQFAGTDSLNQKLVSEEVYNTKGQLVSYYYKDYRETTSIGRCDCKCFNFYKDTLLVLSKVIDYENVYVKTIYSYNRSGQLIREKSFDFKRRYKKNFNKGNGRPGGCIITEDDYEKNKTWEQKSDIVFEYDNKGNRILRDATKLYFSSQDKYTWKYDDKNRIIEHNSFNGKRIIWTERFAYFAGGYQFTRTWYDFNGQVEENSLMTYTYKLNEKGQEIEERVTDEKGALHSSKTTLYHSNGKISKQTTYDSKGQPEITHIYQYE